MCWENNMRRSVYCLNIEYAVLDLLADEDYGYCLNRNTL